MTLLDGLRVLDLSGDIAGPYATKLLADAGADVVKIEGPRGDPLRRWTASGYPLDGCDGALFRYLNASKRSLVGAVDDLAVSELLGRADLLIEDGSLTDEQLAAVRGHAPGLVIASVTPFGRTGPLAGVPATEFTLQAWCGSTAGRGEPDRPPLYAGGRLGEWIAGVYTAVGALGALRGGRGEHVDVSMLECMAITMGGFGSLYAAFTGVLDAARTYPGAVRSIEVPSIYPTADGLVGFCTVTGQQFQDLLVLLERADLIGDERFASAVARMQHRVEFDDIIGAWTATRTTDEVVGLASAFRIPVTAIGTPATIPSMDQFVARRVYVRNPGGGFDQPRVPYVVDGVAPRPFTPAPILDGDRGTVRWDTRRPADGNRMVPPVGRPLEGIRILDLTAFWAGPSATQVLGAMGADVVKVEGLARPDGMRFNSARTPADERWWEASPIFHAVNAGKRAVTLDLGTDDGRRLLLDLVDQADGVIENFSPRVLDTFGITWKAIHARNPRTVMVRMPSFGLDGPWRDRTGFAQTMEQVSGMAWVSGFADGLPVIPRGPCDPLAGMHAAAVFLAALAERDRSGIGRFVEVSMVEAALNCAAEVVIEHSAYRSSLHRDGNRGPVAAPQGVYPCAGREQWIAIAVVDDHAWQALGDALGRPAWTADERFARDADRRSHHDELDRLLAESLAGRDRGQLVDALLSAGVPAAPVLPPAALHDHGQLQGRGFFEPVHHPVVGTHELMSLPFRFASRPELSPWFDRPAPTLGQHNREVLGDLLGIGPTELDQLEADGVIGTSIPT